MGKIFGMLLIVGGVWIGLELYQNGPDGAFGGSFASVLGAESAQADDQAPAPQRGSSVDRAHRDSEARFDRMLTE
jgi:hypothetical protein